MSSCRATNAKPIYSCVRMNLGAEVAFDARVEKTTRGRVLDISFGPTLEHIEAQAAALRAELKQMVLLARQHAATLAKAPAERSLADYIIGQVMRCCRQCRLPYFEDYDEPQCRHGEDTAVTVVAVRLGDPGSVRLQTEDGAQFTAKVRG